MPIGSFGRDSTGFSLSREKRVEKVTAVYE
jgi:hypothetical protein